ncbi:MAG TPA: hypothetical protein VN982_02000 [Candidatus Dormibacteraeota bacterium]|nr:hypothetical protein [Candidatus Dormibacteraeota bacterium]
MKIKCGNRRLRFLFLALLATGGILTLRRESAAAFKKTKEAPEYKEFLNHVQDYVRLHKSLESTLPPLKQTDVPELITAHEQALARKIREARPDAKPGDIFTKDATEAFRKAVHHELHGTEGRHARKTLRQGEPLKEMHLEINQAYPDGLPFTTVPPSLLLKFPKLPAELAYRIVGRDLVLMDVKASLVIDLIKDLLPQT